MMRFATLFTLSLLVLASPVVHAAEQSAKKRPEPTKEERIKRADWMDKMAEAHKKMAECLRSSQPMSECHEQMIKDCPAGRDGHCHMMDEMHGMHWRHGDGPESGKKD